VGSKPFHWPEGKCAAVSLTFDDGRPSQVDCGLPILDRHGVKATFYIVPRALPLRPTEWKRAVANGHEIGNHTVTHPCSGNFPWSRQNALEDYTLRRMEQEFVDADRVIHKALGVKPATFAYPCGQKFVGRGKATKSYVPLVAKHFLAGRGYPDEASNDPTFCEMAQLFGVNMDVLSLAKLKSWVEQAINSGCWLVLAGHDVGAAPRQAITEKTLDGLCRFIMKPANGLWVDTVENIARHISQTR